MRRLVPVLVWGSTFWAVPGSTQAAVPLGDCNAAQVRLSITHIQNAFTGGSYPLWINLHNAGRSACSVKGHPLVVVAPRYYPVTVGDVADFDQNIPYAGPEDRLEVRPGQSVHAYVVVGRPCAGNTNEMAGARI